jgi:hypothetical protein
MTEAPPLSADELTRYARHIVLSEVGGAGQQKFKAARVLVIGAGGLGAPVALYLAAAGIGTLGIVDDDHVSLSNLQRQIIHRSDRVGQAKVESARETLLTINPHVSVVPHQERLTANAAKSSGAGDIVADSSGQFCQFATSPPIFAPRLKKPGHRCGRTLDGSVTVLKPSRGRKSRGYRTSFPPRRLASFAPAPRRHFGRAHRSDRLAGRWRVLVAGIGAPLVGRLLPL